MKIIFLDIDGVLNSENYVIKRCEKTGERVLFDYVDPDAVNRLYNFLQDDEDIGLVITSSWREGDFKNTYKFFRFTYPLSRLCKYVVGITPRLKSRIRGEEVDWFISNINTKQILPYVKGNFEIEDYVIVDDDNDMLDYQKDRLILTDPFYVLVDDDITKIDILLNGENKR